MIIYTLLVYNNRAGHIVEMLHNVLGVDNRHHCRPLQAVTDRYKPLQTVTNRNEPLQTVTNRNKRIHNIRSRYMPPLRGGGYGSVTAEVRITVRRVAAVTFQPTAVSGPSTQRLMHGPKKL